MAVSWRHLAQRLATSAIDISDKRHQRSTSAISDTACAVHLSSCPFQHLFFVVVFELAVVREAQYRRPLYLKEEQTRKFGKFPERTAPTAETDICLLNRKIIVRPPERTHSLAVIM